MRLIVPDPTICIPALRVLGSPRLRWAYRTRAKSRAEIANVEAFRQVFSLHKFQELLFGWNAHKQRLDEQNVALQQEVEDLRLDLEASTSTRRELQQQLQAKKREIEHTQVNSAGLKVSHHHPPARVLLLVTRIRHG